jgi:hypothetical protein
MFLIPGMGHCSGGPGTDTFDGMGTLEQWVEQGKAPKQIVASHLTSGVADRPGRSAFIRGWRCTRAAATRMTRQTCLPQNAATMARVMVGTTSDDD